MVMQLNPDQQSMVARLLETGHFGSASEVIDRGLALVEHEEKLERLRAAIGDDSGDHQAHDTIAFTREWADAQFKSALEGAAAGERPDDPDVWP